MTEFNRLLEEARELLPQAVALRRRIHRQPELGLDLPLTTAAVLDGLQGLPVDIARGPSTSGLVVSLAGARPRPHDPVARRHGRVADAGGDRARLRQRDPRPHARLRPRFAHRDAGAGGASAQPPSRRTRRHREVHVPARRGGLCRRPPDDRGRPDRRRPEARRRLRPAHLPELQTRHDRRPARPAAGLGRHLDDQGEGARRPRLDAACGGRPGPGRLRDRPCPQRDGHPPYRRLRSGRADLRQDHRRHGQQRDPRDGRDGRHPAGHLRGGARHRASRASGGSPPTSPRRICARPR